MEHSTEHMIHQLVGLDRDREILEDASEFARSATPPFFLYIGLTTPHAPYDRYPEQDNSSLFADDAKGNREELYDLLLDPTESSNETGSKNDPLYADKYAELKEVMARTSAAYEVLKEDQTRQLSPEVKQDLRALGYAE